MAEVRLGRFEAEAGRLPHVCIVCGKPTTVGAPQRFAWQPKWVLLLLLLGIVPCIIAGLILERHMTVNVPLCARHVNHWTKRRAWSLGLLGAILAVGIAALSLSDIRSDQPGGLLWTALIGALLGWLVLVAFLHETSIHATEITEPSITLVGVAPDFIEAVLAMSQRFCPQQTFDDELPPRRLGY